MLQGSPRMSRPRAILHVRWDQSERRGMATGYLTLFKKATLFRVLLNEGEGLVQVRDQVLHVLDAAGQPDQVHRDRQLGALDGRVGHL